MRQFYEDLIVIKTPKALTGNVKNYVATATADASIQPLGKEGGGLDTGIFGRTFIAYVDESTYANKGDRVRDQNGTVYDVTDVVIRDIGGLAHKELILKKR